VIGERQSEVEKVFLSKANEMDSKLVFASQQIEFLNYQNGKLAFSNHFSSKKGLEIWIENILPDYQLNNIRTALVAIDEVLKTKAFSTITEAHIRTGIQRMPELSNFIGRWQQLQTSPLIIADSAHNEAGVKIVINQLKQLIFNRLHIVMGTVNDKDVSTILDFYPKEANYYFAKANIPRGLDAQVLKQQANAIGLKGRAYSSVKNAFKAAKRNAEKDDLILVMGSIFVVAEVI
jgi:dihydrofolate synthase/folylpolyglutamate synthase